MDPATAAGLSVGLASLAFDVFDNSIKLFKFMSSMVDMPKECEQYRLQLMIEYNRLLAWGEAVGLVDISNGDGIAENLGTNAVELCSIISRIGWLLGEFRDINARWKNELNPYERTDQSLDRINKNMAEEISSLSLAYDVAREEQKRLRGTNHIMRWMSKGAANAKEIISHPSRVRWVTIDKEAFGALLKDLHSLIDRMHELMGHYREKRIQEMTEEAYREMVLVRNDINELKDMLGAIESVIRGTQNATGTRESGDEIFRDLLRLKEINGVSERLLFNLRDPLGFDIEDELKSLIDVCQYDGVTISNHFTYTEGDFIEDLSRIRRPRGALKVDGKSMEVWIEWRMVESVTSGSVQEKEARVRTATLAQMLHNSKPQHLYTPTCVGYVNDYATSRQYGWIFAMPDGSNESSTLKTLHSILGQDQHKPTLSQRVSLAWKLASSLLYLHATNWLHKGIHSGNVLFSFNDGRFDATNPMLSGFEYARPQSNDTTSRSLDPMWDIYRWPSIQNEAPKVANSRKTYDIYSLGLVLLEIIHWTPLHKILHLKRWPEPSSQDHRVRGWLLGEECYPPFKPSDPLLELRDLVGDKYWRAVKRCLVAHGRLGMLIQEDSDQSHDPGVGLKLQKAFNEFVLGELKDISI